MTTRSVVLCGLVAALLAPAPPARALPPLPASARGGEHVPGEVLVKFRPRAGGAARSRALAALGHTLRASLGGGWVRAATAPGQTVTEAVAAYAANPDVEAAQPNFVYHALAVPGDTLYPLAWGLRNTGQDLSIAPTEPAGSPLYSPATGTPGADMRLEKAWDHVTDCSGVVVAVLDTGVNYGHEDLAANMWDGGASNPNHGKNFVGAVAGGDDGTLDLHGHGTHVAGIIGAAGDNGKGATGVCWRASLMAVRVLDAGGEGTTASIVEGIGFAVSHGAKVINMSLGGGGPADQAYGDAVTAARDADVVVVVAAGNDGTDNDKTSPVYPCNFTQANLVCVAALDQAYQRASFSNFGATSVDVGAPGTNVVSAWPGPVLGDPLSSSGWSFSSTTAGGGWAYSRGLTAQALVDPAKFLTATYADNTDDRVWKAFDLTGATAAVVHFDAAVDVASGDHVRVAWASAPTDPFGPGGTPVDDVTNVSTNGNLVPAAYDISGCIGPTCTVGFQLWSDPFPQTSLGAAIAYFTIGTVRPNAASYNTESGTSMAAPAVAGVAALLRAYNPQFTYADVVGALEGGGRPVAALAGITRTGRAVDAMSALAFVNPPTGLACTVR